MAEKIKIIPLGGLNEIGKNLTVYEYGGDIMQIRGEALRVEQGLAEVTGHHYRGMLAVGGTSGIRIGLRPRRHR